jgi:hypothetical protein
MDTMKSKMTMIKRAATKLKRLRTLNSKHELKVDQKFEANLCNNIKTNTVKKDFYNKNITVIDEISEVQNIAIEAISKKELLQRFLDDSIQNNDIYEFEGSVEYLPVRTREVDCEDVSIFVSEHPERTRGDDEDINDNSIDSGDVPDMNMAFIVSKTRNKHETFTMNDKLNEGILYDTEMTYSEDDESAFEDDSDCYNSECELEQNIFENYAEDTNINLSELRRILNKDKLNSRITEDDLLDSFMNTFVDNEDSDEGRGSVSSDFE